MSPACTGFRCRYWWSEAFQNYPPNCKEKLLSAWERRPEPPPWNKQLAGEPRPSPDRGPPAVCRRLFLFPRLLVDAFLFEPARMASSSLLQVPGETRRRIPVCHSQREPAGAGDMLPLGGLEIGSGDGGAGKTGPTPHPPALGAPPRALASPVLRE